MGTRYAVKTNLPEAFKPDFLEIDPPNLAPVTRDGLDCCPACNRNLSELFLFYTKRTLVAIE